LNRPWTKVNILTQRRIEAAADRWLARQPVHATLSLRFDLVAILPWRGPIHIPAVFTL
jgi:putative endonuclease